MTKPATHEYEYDGDRVFVVNEDGSRRLVGWHFRRQEHHTADTPEGIYHDMVEQSLWEEIRQLAKTNVSLREEMDKIVCLYLLIKGDPNTVPHHPV